jgi:dUTPase
MSNNVSYSMLNREGAAFEYSSKYGYPLQRNGDGSGGFDLITPNMIALRPGQSMKIDTGIRLHLRPGQVALIMARSSWTKLELEFSNAVGLIDWGYCGDGDTIQAVIRKRESSERVLNSWDVSGMTTEALEAFKRELMEDYGPSIKFFNQQVHTSNEPVKILSMISTDYNTMLDSRFPYQYKKGDHFAQLLILETTLGEACWNDSLRIDKNRGGFGTTDKK